MGQLLYELDRIVRDEEDDEASVEKIASKEIDREERGEEKPSGVDSIIKHIEAVEAAADFIDKLTPGENSEDAFDAEIALRRALGKMRELSDTVYKSIENEKEEG